MLLFFGILILLAPNMAMRISRSIDGNLSDIDEGCPPPVDISNVEAVLRSINLTVSCQKDLIAVKINTCVLEQMGYNVSNDISIVGYEKPDSESGKICNVLEEKIGKSFVIQMPDFSACNTKGYAANGSIWYYNGVGSVGFSNTFNKSIVRRRAVYLRFVCEYKANYTATVGDFIPVPGDIVKVEVANEVGAASMTVDLCHDVYCTDGPYQEGDVIGVMDLLSLVVRSPSPHWIEIVELFATKYPDRNSSEKYYLVENGCPEDYTTLINRRPFKVTTEFRMLRWNQEENTPVYYHATVNNCLLEGSCYQPKCDDARHKRSFDHPYTENLDEVQTISLGPFAFVP